MKTFFSFRTFFMALICLSVFVACVPVDTDVSTEDVVDTIVNDRFCYMPLNCLCDGVSSKVKDCSWGGATEQMHTPRCNDKQEYLDLINANLSANTSTNIQAKVYAAFFDEHAICQPRLVRASNQVTCDKECYTDRMWLFPYTNYGVIEICSTDEFVENSFQVLGFPQDSYTVTYESEGGISCFYVDIYSPTGYFPTEWAGDMMIFRVAYK